jgi:hypothetical protein
VVGDQARVIDAPVLPALARCTTQGESPPVFSGQGRRDPRVRADPSRQGHHLLRARLSQACTARGTATPEPRPSTPHLHRSSSSLSAGVKIRFY